MCINILLGGIVICAIALTTGNWEPTKVSMSFEIFTGNKCQPRFLVFFLFPKNFSVFYILDAKKKIQKDQKKSLKILF